MLRILLRTIAAIIAAAIIFFPALVVSLGPSDDDGGGRDPVTITHFESDISIDSAGRLSATETITARFPTGRHGIFRYWDTTDAADANVRFYPEDIEISLNGHDVPVNMSWEQGRKIRVAKIGDPDRTLKPGEHTYIITYEVPGVISAEDEGSRFEWQAIAAGWSMHIDKAEVTIEVPHTPRETLCRLGTGDECTTFATSGNTITISAENLTPNTPIRVAALFDEAAPAQNTLPWPSAFDSVLGTSVVLAAIAGILTIGGVVIGHMMEIHTREKAPGLPVLFEPPEGLGPVQTYYVTHETTGKNPLVSTMMHLAERGDISLSQTGHDNWTITNNREATRWHTQDPVAQQFAAKLGLHVAGQQFSADGSVPAGEQLNKLNAAINSATKSWGNHTGFVVSVVREWMYRIVLIGSTIMAGIFALIPFVPSIWAAPFAALVVGGLWVFAPGVGTRRTAAGRELWSSTGGFERFLTTPSAEDRFLFAERKDLYLEYIPYAVAFDVADSWARRYETAMGTEPPAPTWLPVPIGYSTGHAIASSISSFDSALSSSISAYQATQSSSGGGGGFSGGGGGGGGGGSW